MPPPTSIQPICIVEPDTAVRDGLASFIGLYGDRVCSFANGAALQQQWPELHAAGVLCAVGLPDLSGIELYRWLTSRGPMTPFALTVSTHQHREIESARDAGIAHILHKPLLPSTALVQFIDHTRNASGR